MYDEHTKRNQNMYFGNFYCFVDSSLPLLSFLFSVFHYFSMYSRIIANGTKVFYELFILCYIHFFLLTLSPEIRRIFAKCSLLFGLCLFCFLVFLVVGVGLFLYLFWLHQKKHCKLFEWFSFVLFIFLCCCCCGFSFLFTYLVWILMFHF